MSATDQSTSSTAGRPDAGEPLRPRTVVFGGLTILAESGWSSLVAALLLWVVCAVPLVVVVAVVALAHLWGWFFPHEEEAKAVAVAAVAGTFLLGWFAAFGLSLHAFLHHRLDHRTSMPRPGWWTSFRFALRHALHGYPAALGQGLVPIAVAAPLVYWMPKDNLDNPALTAFAICLGFALVWGVAMAMWPTVRVMQGRASLKRPFASLRASWHGMTNRLAPWLLARLVVVCIVGGVILAMTVSASYMWLLDWNFLDGPLDLDDDHELGAALLGLALPLPFILAYWHVAIVWLNRQPSVNLRIAAPLGIPTMEASVAEAPSDHEQSEHTLDVGIAREHSLPSFRRLCLTHAIPIYLLGTLVIALLVEELTYELQIEQEALPAVIGYGSDDANATGHELYRELADDWNETPATIVDGKHISIRHLPHRVATARTKVQNDTDLPKAANRLLEAHPRFSNVWRALTDEQQDVETIRSSRNGMRGSFWESPIPGVITLHYLAVYDSPDDLLDLIERVCRLYALTPYHFSRRHDEQSVIATQIAQLVAAFLEATREDLSLESLAKIDHSIAIVMQAGPTTSSIGRSWMKRADDDWFELVGRDKVGRILIAEWGRTASRWARYNSVLTESHRKQFEKRSWWAARRAVAKMVSEAELTSEEWVALNREDPHRFVRDLPWLRRYRARDWVDDYSQGETVIREALAYRLMPARLALWVEAYRLRTGAWPVSQDEFMRVLDDPPWPTKHPPRLHYPAFDRQVPFEYSLAASDGFSIAFADDPLLDSNRSTFTRGR